MNYVYSKHNSLFPHAIVPSKVVNILLPSKVLYHVYIINIHSLYKKFHLKVLTLALDMSKLKCIHEPESNECASVKKKNWFLYSKYLISFFAIYFWANEKVTACENNDQGLVSTMITLKKEINIVLRQTHIDYAKLCMHYFDSNLF